MPKGFQRLKMDVESVGVLSIGILSLSHNPKSRHLNARPTAAVDPFCSKVVEGRKVENHQATVLLRFGESDLFTEHI